MCFPAFILLRILCFFSDSENELLGMMADNRDFRETAFIECANCYSGEVSSRNSRPRLLGVENHKDQRSLTRVQDDFQNKIAICAYANGRLNLDVKSESGGWLVFNESFSPGWEARIDGIETQIYRANYIMQGIYVPSGEHKIEFKHIGVIAKKWKEISVFKKSGHRLLENSLSFSFGYD